MVDVIWLGSVAAGAICYGAGMLGWMRNPKSKAATIFMFAMMFIFISFATGTVFRLVDESSSTTADAIATVFVVSFLLAEAFLLMLAVVFPVDRDIELKPPNTAGALMLAALVIAVIVGLFAGVEYDDQGIANLDGTSMGIIFSASVGVMVLAASLILLARDRASQTQWDSGVRYLIGLGIFVVGVSLYAAEAFIEHEVDLLHEYSFLMIVMGAAASGLVFAYSIAMGEMTMPAAPRTETMVSSSKSSFNLRHRHIYLVEEEKPEFSFKMFADILKGRCFDCENDDSFPCESLQCDTCKLPCPCRECTKYRSRAQGLVVTRQHPHEVRSKYFIQTTPIIWLSSVPGKDNMDPAKVNLLTDYLINFMERAHNGVVLVDGIEYLVTTNDFQKIIRSVDRWTETAMTSDCRLVITVDPRAFTERELALLEKNKEVVRPSEDGGLESVKE